MQKSPAFVNQLCWLFHFVRDRYTGILPDVCLKYGYYEGIIALGNGNHPPKVYTLILDTYCLTRGKKNKLLETMLIRSIKVNFCFNHKKNRELMRVVSEIYGF